MRRALLVSLCLIALLGQAALADGMIFPRPVSDKQPFSVTYHHVSVEIADQACRTTVDQAFVNHSGRDLEGTYLFPLPDQASISNFVMYENGKPLTGELLDKEQAVKVYEEIVRKKRDPGLLEYVGRNTIRARVYPVPARGEKRFKVEYSELLAMDGGLVKYVYPLSIERFSAQPLKDLTITVAVRSRVPIKSIYSPTHEISIDRTDDRRATVSFEQSNVKPATDFVLYYALSPKDVGLTLLSYRERGREGYWMLLASPKVPDREDVIAKDVVFVLDRTGSMSGDKIEQAKGALRYCLNSLDRRDRFDVVAFNTSHQSLGDELMPASRKNVKEALDYVDGFKARGGTNIDEALQAGFGLLDDAERPMYLVFLTDGLPTAGERNIDKILGNAKQTNEGRARLFSFGVGYDVNTHLLDRLSEQNAGVTEYVRPNEDIEAKVSAFFAKVSSPVLTDIDVDVTGAKVSEVFPSDYPDLFGGSQLIVVGTYREAGPVTIALRGKVGNRTRTFKVRGSLARRDEEHEFIPVVWASRKIGYLLDEVRLHGEKKELVDEIVRLSQEFGIMTEFTAFLVTEPTVSRHAAAGRVLDSVTVARGEQEGSWAMGQTQNNSRLRTAPAPQAAAAKGGGFGGYGAAAPAGPSGDSVNYGYIDRRGQVQVVRGVQNVGRRTFMQRGNVWEDQDVKPDLPVVAVQNYSRAYFQLAGASRRARRFLAVGEEVKFVLNGQTVVIGSKGKTEFTDKELRALVGDETDSAREGRSGKALARAWQLLTGGGDAGPAAHASALGSQGLVQSTGSGPASGARYLPVAILLGLTVWASASGVRRIRRRRDS